MTTPTLYPVTLHLSCPRHGVVTTITVLSLEAQQSCEEYYREVHGHLCVEKLETLVADEQVLS